MAFDCAFVQFPLPQAIAKLTLTELASVPPPTRRRAVSTSMSADQPQSRLFGQFSLRDAPGWLVSLGVHLAIMVVLLLVKFNTHLSADSTFLNAIEDVTTETAFDPTDTDQVGIGTEVTSLSPTSGVAPGTAG